MAAALPLDTAVPRRRALAVIGLLLTLLLPALDGTVVGTAMPRLLADLNALDRHTWLTTAYLLTSTVSVPSPPSFRSVPSPGFHTIRSLPASPAGRCEGAEISRSDDSGC